LPQSSSHVASTSKTVFVEPEISETHVGCLNKGKNVMVHEHVKTESKIHVKKQSKFKFIPTCFHYGIIGHTRPYCHQIHSQKLWTKKHDPKKVKTGKNSSMPKYVPRKKKKKKKTHECKHDSSYSRKSCEGLFHMMRDILTRLDKLDKGHNTAPRVKKAWVRKIDTIHPLRGSGSGFT